ncbi:hypothetical protein GGR51DRAFT_101705 [Nemania sp. FL0031]|nr:hypothetical protein GGR51DRAFT_101705 [Nemania sp. FL0031]
MSLELPLRQRTRYTRIRIQHEDDIDKLYPLILDYIREPELASSVKEFIFRLPLPTREGYLVKTDRPEVLRADEKNRDISQEHIISQLVTDLGLQEVEKPDWIRILTWMKPELVAAREEALDGDEREFEVEPFYRFRTELFAHYAGAILMLLCPNIEILKYEEGSKIIENVLRRNNYGVFPETHLKKLRDVTIIPTNDLFRGDDRFYTHLNLLDLVRMFHRLPAIESVSTDTVGIDSGMPYLVRFPPAVSNLKRIRVGHAMYGTDIIRPLIRLSRRLEEFTFTTGGRNNLHGGFATRSAKVIGKALYEHRTSLRKIDIDIDEYIGGRDEDSPSDEAPSNDPWYKTDLNISTKPSTTVPNTREYGKTIGSMHDFESLTHLSIGIGLLLGPRKYRAEENEEAPFRLAEALPNSLEYLMIRGYKRGTVPSYDSQIDEFLLTKQERLPSLKELHGIDETIPIAVSIEDPDNNTDKLWQPEELDESWLEVVS